MLCSDVADKNSGWSRICDPTPTRVPPRRDEGYTDLGVAPQGQIFGLPGQGAGVVKVMPVNFRMLKIM